MPARKPKKEKRVAISVRLKPALYRRLEALAEKTERSISWHIARTMEESVDRIEYEVDAILEGMADVKAGRGRDADEVMREIQAMLKAAGVSHARKAG